MNSTFDPGQTVWLEIAGERCEIQELIGSGVRGQVYRATISGRDCALKWYFPPNATKERRAALERLIQKGTPNDHFLWPSDIALCQGRASFGYVMPLRHPSYRSMAELMTREFEPPFRTLIAAGIDLADNFLRLHSLGLCYGDISFGNVYIDPVTGEVCLCDNDRVAAEGEAMDGMPGAPRFMAPEVLRGEGRPGGAADLHSLAVILFYFFMVHHPLEGRRESEFHCLDFGAVQKLCAIDPLFIFDPKLGVNRPVSGIQNNATLFWNFYPGYVRDFFTRAFTDGLSDPAARVRESEWRSVLNRMRDHIFYCHKCGGENFLLNEGDAPAPPVEQKCWYCGEQAIAPMRLRLGQSSVVLNQDTLLYAHHLDAGRRNEYSEVMAEMTPHPKRADVWGLKNVSTQTWTGVPATGKPVEVPPGRTISMAPGLRIRFGNVEGVVA